MMQTVKLPGGRSLLSGVIYKLEEPFARELIESKKAVEFMDKPRGEPMD